MKALVVLSVLQVVLLLFLLGKSALLEDRLDAMENDGAAGVEFGAPTQNRQGAQPGEHLTGLQLRAIVREELAAQLVASTEAEPEARPADVGEADDPQYQYQVREVTQKLDLYQSVGAISDNDMHDLQSEIMALQEPERTAAMRQLIRALNSGDVKGRF
jgi:hypothetical protein